MFDLNSENIQSFSENSYRNPQCICAEDFHEDMNRVKYVKRLLNKYKKGEELKTRLILNHIICFYNVFDKYSATRIWFFKIDREYWSVLKTFLEYLSLMPVVVHGVNGENIFSENLKTDENVLRDLENL